MDVKKTKILLFSFSYWLTFLPRQDNISFQQYQHQLIIFSSVRRMSDDSNFANSFTCAICLDIPSVNDAVETSCCHQLYCSPCIKTVDTCPTCRQNNLQTTPAYFARRLIGSLTVLCPNEGCNTKVTRSDLDKHLSVHCQFRQLTCPDAQCKEMKYTKKAFLEHLLSKHGDYLLENFSKLWQKEETTGRMTVIQSREETNSRDYEDCT